MMEASDRADKEQRWMEERVWPTWMIRVGGGLLALLGMLILVSLMSYRPAEVGWSVLRPDGIQPVEGCTNMLGVVGLYTANILYSLFGLGAIYGAFLLQVPAWGIVLNPEEKRVGQWIAMGVMLFTACCALAVQPWFFTECTARLGLVSCGGWVGFLPGTKALQALLGVQRSLGFFILFHAIALIYIARVTPIDLCRAVKEDILRLIAYLRERRRLARERKEREAVSWRISLPPEEPKSETPPNVSPESGALFAPQSSFSHPESQRSHTPAPQPTDTRDETREPESVQSPSQLPPKQPLAPAPVISRPSPVKQGGENLLKLNEQNPDGLPVSNQLVRRTGETDTSSGKSGLILNPSMVRAIEKHLGVKTPPEAVNNVAPVSRPSKIALPPPRRHDLDDYPLPSYELLKYEPIPESVREQARAEMLETQATIIDTLESFKIPVQGGDITRGPSVTRYEFMVPRGQTVKAVAGKSKDIMAATQSTSVNILAPIPGKSTVGVELENSVKEPVYLRELLMSEEFHNPKNRIPVALGKDVYGNPVIGDLAGMPHVLVAGSTGSGKSVCINSMLVSFLYKFRPDKLRLVLVDPKVVEMQPYNKLPHLAVPVVTQPERVIGALRWAVNEMEYRYKLFSRIGVRNLEDYNALPDDVKLTAPPQEDVSPSIEDPDAADAIVRDVEDSQGEDLPEETEEDLMQDELDFAERGPMPLHLPYIVIVIDELADLMMQVKQDLEVYIGRLTQKARAAGLHLIVATQSPRAQVVTGIIKTNLPSRIALKVSSQLDSRVILDEGGAENLLGRGDLLYLPPGGPSKMTRAQGAFVSDAEIAAIINHCASHAEQHFVQGAAEIINEADSGGGDFSKSSRGGSAPINDEEELYNRCVSLVITERKASTSLLQRRFSIGYGRAAKIMDLMEERGVISPQQSGSKAREVLIDS